nr:hypothetical protein [Mangrovicoccus sp. HB161399]
MRSLKIDTGDNNLENHRDLGPLHQAEIVAGFASVRRLPFIAAERGLAFLCQQRPGPVADRVRNQFDSSLGGQAVRQAPADLAQEDYAQTAVRGVVVAELVAPLAELLEVAVMFGRSDPQGLPEPVRVRVLCGSGGSEAEQRCRGPKGGRKLHGVASPGD